MSEGHVAIITAKAPRKAYHERHTKGEPICAQCCTSSNRDAMGIAEVQHRQRGKVQACLFFQGPEASPSYHKVTASGRSQSVNHGRRRPRFRCTSQASPSNLVSRGLDTRYKFVLGCRCGRKSFFLELDWTGWHCQNHPDEVQGKSNSC